MATSARKIDWFYIYRQPSLIKHTYSIDLQGTHFKPAIKSKNLLLIILFNCIKYTLLH